MFKDLYGDFDNFLKTTQLHFVFFNLLLLLLLLRVSVSAAQVRCDLF